MAAQSRSWYFKPIQFLKFLKTVLEHSFRRFLSLFDDSLGLVSSDLLSGGSSRDNGEYSEGVSDETVGVGGNGSVVDDRVQTSGISVGRGVHVLRVLGLNKLDLLRVGGRGGVDGLEGGCLVGDGRLGYAGHDVGSVVGQERSLGGGSAEKNNQVFHIGGC